MNIEGAISTDYTELSPDDRVSKLVGSFEDPTVKGVIVSGSEYRGVVTRRQLTGSHHQPDEKLSSLIWHVPQLTPDEDIRKVAQLMIDSDSHILPVFEGGELRGVVTVDGILDAVEQFLDAATVGDTYSRNLHSVSPETTFGKAVHLLRDNRITHLPVVEDASAVGIVSLYDLTDLTVRSIRQSQGGDAGGQDAFGGEISSSAARSRRGGYGAREGELERMLDLPVSDVMTDPVRTITPEQTLDRAVQEMFSAGASSLVVSEDGEPMGILTKTDILDTLTWEAGGNRAVQIYGIDLLDDISHEEVVEMIDKFADRDHGIDVLDARIHMQKHDEKRRGVPLLLARVRLHTDAGLYMASGEGYGASHALNEARDVLERRIRDRKTHGKSKKPPSEEFWERRFGWLLEE